MKPQFILKRTDELTEREKEQFIDLFSLTFAKDMTPDWFDRKYLRTPLGYSYHGLMLAGSSIVGAYNAIPYMYRYFGRNGTFCLSVDTMIHEQYRKGPFSLVRMAELVLNAMEQDRICFAFGFPNDNAYEYAKKVLHWRDIGELDYYILPRNVGAVVPKLRWLNLVSRTCSDTLVRLPLRRRRIDPHACLHWQTWGVEKVRSKEFEGHRYDSSYRMVNLGAAGECVYRIHLEDGGVRVLYVIDVYPLTPAVFDAAIERVYVESAHTVDLVLYVGKLPFVPTRMIRLPKSKRPREVKMCGKILDPGVIDDRVFQIENWNVNISNFDVR